MKETETHLRASPLFVSFLYVPFSARALHRLDIEMSNTQLKDLLTHLDANGDGVVDAGEFLDAMRRHEESMQGTPAKGIEYVEGDRLQHSRLSSSGGSVGFGSSSRRTSPFDGRRSGGNSSGSPIRSLTGSRGSTGTPRHSREELMGGGGGSLLSPSRTRRASYVSPRSTDKDVMTQDDLKPEWKR